MSFRSHGVLVKAEPKAIVVYCLDSRFQEAFNAFIHGELELDYGEFCPIAIAGGASVLARPAENSDGYRLVMSNIELLLRENPSIQRVVLINHADCRAMPLSKSEAEKALWMAAKNIKNHSLWHLATKRDVNLELYYVGNEEIWQIYLPDYETAAA